MFRGWCNYFKYANNPQSVFGKIASRMWWAFAHYKARKHRSSIKKMLILERKSNRNRLIEKGGRAKQTFVEEVGKRTILLDILPPPTTQIGNLKSRQNWEVDLQPVRPLSWQSGRSLMTRMTAIKRANGLCEMCQTNLVLHVHHKRPMRGKNFLARVQSDRTQRETAIALCRECHLAVHKGSFNGKKPELERRMR